MPPRAHSVALVTALVACGLGGCSVFFDLNGLSGHGADAGDGALESSVDAGGDGGSPETGPGEGGATDAGAAETGSFVSPYRAAVLSDTPIAYWRLGEDGGTTAADQTGHNDGIYAASGVTFGVSGAIVNDPDTAIHCNASSAVSVASQALDFPGKKPVTIEMWVKPDVIDSNYRYVLYRENDDPRNGYGVFVNAQDISFERIGADGGFDDIGITGTTGIYSYIVFTFDGTTVTSYLNAVQDQSYAFIQSIVSSSAPLTICGGLNSTGFEGDLDEVAIYGTALPAARIAEHYTVGRGM